MPADTREPRPQPSAPGSTAGANDSAKVVERVSDILAAFGDDARTLGLSELARRTGLPKTTVHRLARDLVACRILERDGTSFRLGLRMFEMGQRVQRTLREVAIPYMADLREATKQTVNLAVLEGGDVVYVEILRPHGAPAALTQARSGGRLPAHATGVGKALLAFSPPEVIDQVLARPLVRMSGRTVVSPRRIREDLAMIRKAGVAFDVEESAPGLLCAACPILGPGGRLLGGLSVSGFRHQMILDNVASAVRMSALALSRALGGERHVAGP